MREKREEKVEERETRKKAKRESGERFTSQKRMGFKLEMTGGNKFLYLHEQVSQKNTPKKKKKKSESAIRRGKKESVRE